MIFIVYSINYSCTGDHKYQLQVYYYTAGTVTNTMLNVATQHIKLLTSKVFFNMPLWSLQTKNTYLNG